MSMCTDVKLGGIIISSVMKGEKHMSKHGGKKRSTGGLILDVILTFFTGGLWLIWILIRYLRNNS